MKDGSRGKMVGKGMRRLGDGGEQAIGVGEHEGEQVGERVGVGEGVGVVGMGARE